MNDQILIGVNAGVHDTIRLAAPRRFPEIDESRLQLSQRLSSESPDGGGGADLMPRLIDTLDSRTLQGLPLRPRSSDGEPYTRAPIPAPRRSPRPRTPAVRVASTKAATTPRTGNLRAVPSLVEAKPASSISSASSAVEPVGPAGYRAVRLEPEMTETPSPAVAIRSGKTKTIALGLALAAIVAALLIFVILPSFVG